MKRLFAWSFAVGLVGFAIPCSPLFGQDPTTEPTPATQTTRQDADSNWPTLLSPPFSETNDPANWEFSDDGWQFKAEQGQVVLSQFRKQSKYNPPVRSPFHRAILKNPSVTDFQLDVQVRSTHPDYGHRDVCLFFGYQNPRQFYYVHLGKLTDPHCNQIFIVNEEPRSKISVKTNDGIPWDDQWHHVRIIRKTESGEILVFFDNMQDPVMTASDQTFSHGRIGLGSFDDTSDWRNLSLSGQEYQPTESKTDTDLQQSSPDRPEPTTSLPTDATSEPISDSISDSNSAVVLGESLFFQPGLH